MRIAVDSFRALLISIFQLAKISTVLLPLFHERRFPQLGQYIFLTERWGPAHLLSFASREALP